MATNLSIRNCIRVITLVCAVLFVGTACNKSPKTLQPLAIDPAFSSYVISFTSGIISGNSPIRVRFVQEIPSAVIGEKLAKNPFSFSPRIAGDAFWIDAQTIEFRPEKPLTSGQVYTARCNIAQFLEVPKNLSTLEFRFQVMHQAFEFEFAGFESYDLQDYHWQKVHGAFRTADFVEQDVFEKAISLSFGSEKLQMKWTASENGKLFAFVIDSVPRKKSSQTLSITCNGKEFGAKENKTFRVTIPKIDDFSVVSVATTTQPNTCVTVYFSDPLSPTQGRVADFFALGNVSCRVVVDGSIVKLYPSRTVKGQILLEVLEGIQNSKGVGLSKRFSQVVDFVSMLPKVELLGSGIIVPNTEGVLFPFRAVSLSAVDVKIIQIFENNIAQFLQVNQFDGQRELARVGRIVYNQEVPLTSDKPIDYGTWNNFSLDLSKLIQTEPGAIYRVQISFRKKHSLFACSQSELLDEDEYREEPENLKMYDEPSNSYYYYYDDYDDYDYYNYGRYVWSERDNPCKPSYYMRNNQTVVRNVLASDLGIIAKAGSDGNYNVYITDLRTTKPISGVEVELRNYQNQLLGTAKTNREGMCIIQSQNKPFLLVAKHNTQRGYLRLDDASSLSVSMFNVQGQDLQKGVKGFMYGERGVWRPGDSLYITFILEDKNKSLPANHPVVFELYTPENQLSKRIVKTQNLNGFYTFFTSTIEDDPTGNWRAVVSVGGSRFTQTIKIETIKPNRMKILMNLSEKDIVKRNESKSVNLEVNWLHGAPAQNAPVKIDATMRAGKTSFKDLEQYTFDNPALSFDADEFSVFDARVDATGKARVHLSFPEVRNAPGMLNVQLRTRAFDAGGDFSIDRFVVKYSPYDAYVGLRMPEGTGWNKALYSDEKNIIPLALVDPSGKPISGNVRIEIFSVYWRWWWDISSEADLAHYISNSYSNRIFSETVAVKNGRHMYEMNLDMEHWGRKFIRVTHLESGHSAGQTFYTTYRGWWSNAGSENPGGAEMLQFETDKDVYSVGESVVLTLPVSHAGRALVSVESGSRVVSSFWVETSKNARIEFEATAHMSPNVFIHVSYIQPHNQTNNQLPIRMYGIQNIRVEDPETILKPQITMSDELKPEEKFTVKVHEQNGKPMTYTIAIVDDGLLDVTRFRTPNPWHTFNAREALGVRTWDLYKYVAGAFAGELAGLLQIGGDEYLLKQDADDKNRFKPVVMVYGPFEIKKGASQTHTFTMPNYVGSVRCMVVAGQNGAYGNAEKTVPVRQALMVLPTIPRVVSPTETIKIPVTVFAMDKSIKQVNVKLTVDKEFSIVDGATRTISFAGESEKVVEFTVKAVDRIGVGKISVEASSGTIKASSDTHLEIRVPNPVTSRIIQAVLEPGKSWQQTVSVFGISGTNAGVIEISHMKPIDLERRLQYLIRYPHGCIEQTTSGAFPQLFLQTVTNLSNQQKEQISHHMNEAIERLQKFQLSSGAFSYWPSEGYVCEWSTNYVGHFFVEAQKQGYQLPHNLLDNWVSYQTRQAQAWRADEQTNRNNDFTQAYRLYVLALANKPAESAMNRMREVSSLSSAAKWRLAAAYALTGKSDISRSIIATIQADATDRHHRYSYGSPTRDNAMILESLVLLKDLQSAREYAEKLAEELSSETWMSTQTTAYALLAMAQFAKSMGSDVDLQAELAIGGQTKRVSSKTAVYQEPLDFSAQTKYEVKITNTSNVTQFVRVHVQGVPQMVETSSEQSQLQMSVAYFTLKGEPLNVKRIKQGTDFYAEVRITHPGVRPPYTDLALEQLFPSGWEIMNTRMDLVASTRSVDEPRYQDIRDDRVYSYFDLNRGETKVFRVMLHAAYTGTYFMPSVYCQPMYDNTVYAKEGSFWVEVVK